MGVIGWRRRAGETPAPGAFPRGVIALTAGMLAATAALTAAALPSSGGARGASPLTALALVALLLAASHFLLRFQYRSEVEALDLFEAALAPAIAILPGTLVVAAVAAAKGAAGILHRNHPVKAAFNLAQWSLAAAAGAAVFARLAGPGRLSGRTVTGLVAAIVVVALINQAAFVWVMRLSQRQPLRAVLAGLRPVILPGWLVGWVVNVAFGVLFAVCAAWDPRTIPLFFIPLVTLHHAYRGYATALADRAGMAGLHRAMRALAGPVDPRDAIVPFLREVRDCFRASAAEMLLIEGRGARVPGPGAGDRDGSEEAPPAELLHLGQATRLEAATAPAPLAAFLERRGWSECLAAPLSQGRQVLGVLCVGNPAGLRGSEEGRLAVLDTLAAEAAHALIKGGLLDAVLEERRKFSDIVARTSDGIMTISPAGIVRTWNAALERITGYPASRMVGARPSPALRPRDADGIAVWFERWAEDLAALPADVQVTTRAGETRWLSCSYTRVAAADGRPGMMIVVARDATEARELERLKDDFVATVSHELRTPLTPIKGWAATLLELGDHLSSEQRREGMRAILRHADRLERLITNILEVSRIERGLFDRREAVVDVQAVVSRTVDEFRSEHPARAVVLATEGTRHLTRGDEVWIEQIVSNLLSNAAKYSPADEPIRVTVRRSAGAIEVSVADRGPGIPEPERERIFERFKRLGDHMTRRQGGTGLGLYIARQLARATGGELTVHGAPGEGATFTLRLSPIALPVPLVS